MKKEIIINYRNKNLKVIAEDCNFLKKFIGLMFSRRQKAEILLFHFKKKQKIKIHSFFVFYPFVALWFDDENNIVDVKIVEPFTFCVSSKKPVCNLLEVPFNEKYKRIIKTIITDGGLETFK